MGIIASEQVGLRREIVDTAEVGAQPHASLTVAADGVNAVVGKREARIGERSGQMLLLPCLEIDDVEAVLGTCPQFLVGAQQE